MALLTCFKNLLEVSCLERALLNRLVGLFSGDSSGHVFELLSSGAGVRHLLQAPSSSGTLFQHFPTAFVPGRF